MVDFIASCDIAKLTLVTFGSILAIKRLVYLLLKYVNGISFILSADLSPIFADFMVGMNPEAEITLRVKVFYCLLKRF